MGKYDDKQHGSSDINLGEHMSPPARRPVTQKVSGPMGGAHGTRPNDPEVRVK